MDYYPMHGEMPFPRQELVSTYQFGKHQIHLRQISQGNCYGRSLLFMHLSIDDVSDESLAMVEGGKISYLPDVKKYHVVFPDGEKADFAPDDFDRGLIGICICRWEPSN